MTDLVFDENSILIDNIRKAKTTNSWDDEEYAIFQKNKKKVDPVYLQKDIETPYGKSKKF